MNDESQTDSLAGVTKVSEMRSIAQIDLAEFDAVDVLVTEKLDGTSVRVGFTSGQAWCGGHNHILTVGEKHRYDGFGWGIYVSETGLIDKVTKHAEQRGADFAIYGEFCGPKIQKNLYGLDATEIFVFDMRSQGKWLPWEEVVELSALMGLRTVPVEQLGGHLDHAQLEDYFRSVSKLNPELARREGIVIKALDESMRFNDGKRMIAKYRHEEERRAKPKKEISEKEKLLRSVGSVAREYMTLGRVKKAISHLREENSAIDFKSVISELQRDIIKEADPEHRELFEANEREFAKSVSKLFGSNQEYRELVQSEAAG